MKKGVRDSCFFFNFTFFCQNRSPSKMELLLWYHQSLTYSRFVALKDCLRTRDLLFSFSIPHFAGTIFSVVEFWHYSKKKKILIKWIFFDGWKAPQYRQYRGINYLVNNTIHKNSWFIKLIFFLHLRKNNPFLILIFFFRNIDCFVRSLQMTVAASNC